MTNTCSTLKVLAFLAFWGATASAHVLGQQGGILPSNPVNPHAYTPPKPSVKVAQKPPAPRPAGAGMSDLERFRASRQVNQLLASTIDQDHEDAGVESAGGGPYTGVFALHSVYQIGTIQLKLPATATKTQILYAPTTRPPNGACLEVGTAYTTDITTKQTVATVYVFDFCKPGGGDFAIPPIAVAGRPEPILIDTNFMTTYAGAVTHDSPAYAVAIFTTDSTVSSTSNWYAQLFNYTTKQWETKYSTQGSFPEDPRGWSIFETYFQAGLCSESLPPLGADELSFFNSATQAWERVAKQLQGLPVHISYGGTHNNNCFVADQTGPASYTVAPTPPEFYWWQVLSH
jgi:hypothetical protein